MGFDVRVAGNWKQGEAPTFSHTYSFTRRLIKFCPTAATTLFSENDRHTIDHNDPRLPQVLEELSAFLDGYTPESHEQDATSFLSFTIGGNDVETLHGTQKFEGLESPDDSYVKGAAYALKRVIIHAMANQCDIEVS